MTFSNDSRRVLPYLLVAALAISSSACTDTAIDTEQGQTAAEIDSRVDDDAEYTAPVHHVHIGHGKPASKHFDDGPARFETSQPFRQLSWMMEAGDASQLQYRVPGTSGTQSTWRDVELTWQDGHFANALIRLDEPTTVLEMRGGETIRSAEFEFYEEILAREAPLVDPRLNDGAKRHPAWADDTEIDTARQAVAPSSLVVPRADWGATDPDKVCGSVVDPYRMSIHHTYAPSNDGGDPAARMRQMQSYHMNNLGWCDIGYHFVISQSGQIFQGRSRSNRPGAHVGGQNSGNVGISFIADFTTQIPTETQLSTGADIVEWVHQEHGVPLDRSVIKGHREWPNQWTSCPGDAMIHRIDAIIDRAAGSEPVEPDPVFDANLDVRIVDLDDFYSDGSSRRVADALPGQQFQAHIDLKNESDQRLESVQIGVSVEAPFLAPVDYTIYTDHPEYDLSSWTINSADPSLTSDNPDALGADGHLEMHGFAPNETKRVVVDLVADQYSIGQIDHAEVRAWLTDADSEEAVDVDGVFDGHGGGWDDQASTSELGAQLRDSVSVDVLSRDEWLFESLQNEADLEGWFACYPGHHDALIHNTNFGAMAMEVTGDRACVAAPGWTRIDADQFDEMIIEVRSHDGAHDKALFWATDDDLPPAQFPCDEVDRVFGTDRYASSAAVSKREFPGGADQAVLVLGDEPTSDAIAGSALAAHRGGPLLLTRGDELPDAIADELTRLDVDDATIVGGEAVITADVEGDLSALGIDVDRLAGPTRFATAATVAKEMGAPGNTAILISAAADSLVDGIYGAGLAAQLDAPVLLAQGETLPEDTVQVLDELDVDKTIIVGGESAISSSIESALPMPQRLSGATRYETAMAVAEYIFELEGAPQRVFIARDDNVIDAFSASAIGDVVMLSRPEALTHGVSTVLTGHASSATLVGGTAALSEDVERDACDAFRVQAAYDNTRAVSFDAPGDGDFHTLRLALSDEDGWDGIISYLRVMPLYDRSPSEGESPWQDIGMIFFQDSATSQTSSDVYGYTEATLVDTEEIDDEPTAPDEEGSEEEEEEESEEEDQESEEEEESEEEDQESEDESNQETPEENDGESDEDSQEESQQEDSGQVTAETSRCSSVAADGTPYGHLAMLLVFGLVALRRER